MGGLHDDAYDSVSPGPDTLPSPQELLALSFLPTQFFRDPAEESGPASVPSDLKSCFIHPLTFSHLLSHLCCGCHGSIALLAAKSKREASSVSNLK